MSFPDDFYFYLAFMVFTGIAVYAQSLTGFALSLVLLGLVGLTNAVPLEDAINAVSIIAAVNAALFLHRRRPFKLEPALKPVIMGSLFGYFAGMGAITLLAAHHFELLRALLGISIIACALLLWRTTAARERPSSRTKFAMVGGLSGILGGLFSTPGPPLVYEVYRQPWSLRTVQESLVLCFGVGAAFRLTVMGALGQVSSQAIVLGLAALPVVFVVTVLTANRKPPFSRAVLKHVVCVLLICTGAGMLV